MAIFIQQKNKDPFITEFIKLDAKEMPAFNGFMLL
jgi:hypothetical protein